MTATDVDEPVLHHELPASPYPGLREFREEYADFFFGRDAERQRIIGNLRVARLTLLYAESGVGKSSLLRAGVVPRIEESARKRQASGRDAHFIPLVFSSWSEEPVAAIIATIPAAIAPFVTEMPALPTDLAGALNVAAQAADATLLVILDQFEEFFLYHLNGPDGGGDFARQLAGCVNDPNVAAHFLLSIREDAYAGIGDLLNGLIPNVYGNYLHLDYLDRESARDAILSPVERMNERRPDDPPVTLEPDLVDAVLEQVRHDRVAARADAHVPDATNGSIDSTRVETTYLQLVMRRLWDVESAAGSDRLRTQTLTDLGGARTIIGSHLDESMSLLTADQQVVAAAAFRHLVTPTGSKIALAVEDLAELTELPAADLTTVVDRLAAPDLHILRRVTAPESTALVRHEIFHDALARPISDWRRRFTTRRDHELLEAKVETERIQKEQAQAESEIATERAAHERKRRKRAVMGLVVAVSALVVTLIGGLLYAVNDSRENSARAEATSSAGRIAGMESPTFPMGAVGLAEIESQGLSPTFEARSQVSTVLQSNAALPVLGSGHQRSVTSVVYVDDDVLASAGSDGTVKLWDRRGNEITPEGFNDGADGELTDDSAIAALAVAESGGRSQLLAGRTTGWLDVWDVTDPATAHRPPGITAGLIAPATATKQDTGGAVPVDESDVDVEEASLMALAVSPDGSEIAIGHDDGTVDIATFGADGSFPSQRLAEGLGQVNSLAYRSDGLALAVASSDGVATIDRRPGAPVAPTWLAEGGWVSTVAFAPDGSVVWADSDSVDLQPPTGAAEANWLPTAGSMQTLTFTPTGDQLVGAGDDSSVTVWDVATGEMVGPPRTIRTGFTVRSVAVSPNGEGMAAGGDDSVVRQWPLDQTYGRTTAVMTLPTTEATTGDPADSVNVSRLVVGSNDRVAAAAGEGGALIWRAEPSASPEFVARIEPQPDSSTDSVALRGDRLVVADNDFTNNESVLSLHDLSRKCGSDDPCPYRSGETRLDALATSMDFDRTGRYLVVGDDVGAVHLFEVDTSGTTFTPLDSSCDLESGVNAVDVSPTTDVLAVADDGAVQLCDMSDPAGSGVTGLGEPTTLSAPAFAVAFDGSGDRLATGGADQQVTIWSVRPDEDVPLTRSPSSILQTNSITALAFSPDSSVLAVGDGDGSACVWDVEQLRGIGSCLTGRYAVSRSVIDALAFSPDGRSLFTGGRLNPAVVWDSVLWADPETDPDAGSRQRDLMCRLAGKNLTEEQWAIAFEGTSLADDRHGTCPS